MIELVDFNDGLYEGGRCRCRTKKTRRSRAAGAKKDAGTKSEASHAKG